MGSFDFWKDWCPFCRKETKQKFYDSGHERCSYNNWQECETCGAHKRDHDNYFSLDDKILDADYGFEERYCDDCNSYPLSSDCQCYKDQRGL